jgi:hypothetical protein
MVLLAQGRGHQPSKATDMQVAHPKPLHQPQQAVRPQNAIDEPRVSTDRIQREQSVVKRDHHKPSRSPHKPQAPKRIEPAQSVAVTGPTVEPDAQPQGSQVSFQAYGQTVYILPLNKEAEPIERPTLGIVRNRGPEWEFIKPQGG